MRVGKEYYVNSSIKTNVGENKMENNQNDPVVDPVLTPDPEHARRVEYETSLGNQSPAVDDVQASQNYSSSAAFPTPADPSTDDQAAAPTTETTKEQAAKKPRRKPVKGVVAKARKLLASGKEDSAILDTLQAMYMKAGRDEKNAKNSAYVVLYDVKNREKKAKS